VEDGAVVCSKRFADGRERDISDALEQGAYFGELALLNDDVRQATVRAVKPTRCAAVDRATFKRVLGPLAEILRQNEEMYAKYCDEAEAK
jgi:cAMP-dependent protein kinase regulator